MKRKNTFILNESAILKNSLGKCVLSQKVKDLVEDFYV